MPLISLGGQRANDAINWESLVRGIPGSTEGADLTRMVTSGDFTKYSSPYLSGKTFPSHLDSPSLPDGLRVIEVFCFDDETAFTAHQDVLYAWTGTRDAIMDTLVVPLGTLDALMKLPSSLTKIFSKSGQSSAPKFSQRDVLYVTDQGLYHQGALGSTYMASSGKKRQRDGSEGLLRWDDVKELPGPGANSSLKGPNESFACPVAVGLLLPLLSFPGPSYASPEGMVSFQLESRSTEMKQAGGNGRWEQRTKITIPVNYVQPATQHFPVPRVYPHSALLYKLIEAGIAGKLPK